MKILRIIIINLILLVCVVISVDFITYKMVCKEYYDTFDGEIPVIFPPPPYSYTNEYSRGTLHYLRDCDIWKVFRPPTDDNLIPPIKPPILIFGCSFAYGGLLPHDKVISYKMQKLSNRRVYNYGLCSGGIQHMLYLIQNKRFLEPVQGKPEYAIFIYIADHQRRLNLNTNPIENNGLYLTYKFKNNKLELQKDIFPPFYYRSFIIRKIQGYNYDRYLQKEYTKQVMYDNMILTNELFLESRKLLEKKYPGIKFVILKYSDFQVATEYEFLWDVLKKEGFIILDTQDLIGRKFTVDDTMCDHFHPNENAWDILAPKLVEQLDL